MLAAAPRSSSTRFLSTPSNLPAQLARASAPQARDPHRRHEPQHQNDDERRDRHAVDQQRQSESGQQHETEDDVRARDDGEHEVVHRIADRIDEWWSREADQRAPQLPARTCGKRASGTARELVKCQLTSRVSLPQAPRRAFALEIACERDTPLHKRDDKPADESPDHQKRVRSSSHFLPGESVLISLSRSISSDSACWSGTTVLRGRLVGRRGGASGG